MKTQIIGTKTVQKEPADYFEMKMHMESGAMQDEINQMVINGMKISIINGKVGIRCDYVRIYDYSENVVISRFRKDFPTTPNLQ